MVERIRELLNRFPEDEGTVRTLIRENPRFDALCREYANIVRILRYLEEAETPNLVSQTRALRERRTSLEEQLLTRIEGYEPV